MLLFKMCVYFIGRGNIEKGCSYIIRNVSPWEAEGVNITCLSTVYCIELTYKSILLLVGLKFSVMG